MSSISDDKIMVTTVTCPRKLWLKYRAICTMKDKTAYGMLIELIEKYVAENSGIFK